MEYPDYFPIERPMRMLLAVALLLAMFSLNAAEIEVTVLDRDGEPVPNIAVYVQLDHDGPLPAPTDSAVMAQIDTRFVPHFLVVQTGTQVEFSNSDVVAHHVYSFSNPNNFMLPLYKGDLQTQIEFDHDGVVTLGCNIHDHMLAYILVVDSRVFGKTNIEGKAQLTTDNPNGLTVNIWSPRIELNHENLIQTVKAGRSAQITFLLTEKLRAPYSDDLEALSWNQH
ncbi:MAG: methylamine utilization protein [Proteobacteria bacterium]|nr:methylamine utilization protein [Pseudomonadota bacterium]